jgi:arginine/lysine/ornithine decarboxylase
VILTGSADQMDGNTLMRRLREEFAVELEMAGPGYALAMTSLMDSDEGFDRLKNGLLSLDREWKRMEEALNGFPLPEKALEVGAAMEAEAEKVPLQEAVGRVLADEISMFPPETPLYVPGEVLSKEGAEYLLELERKGYCLHGMEKGAVLVLC